MLTAEHGKVLTDAMGEVARGLENIEFACGIPQLIKGEYSEQAASGIDVYSIRQPLGVVAGITPFNFPAMVPMWMFANALACGNTFVLKPSEKDPSVSLFLAELLATGRSARRVLQRRAGRQGRRRRAARTPRHRRGQLRRLDPDRQVHLRDRHRQRQAGAGARRREEPHARAQRRRRRHGRRRGDRRRLRLGRRALHGGQRRARLGEHRRRTGGQDRRTHPAGQGRARQRGRQRDGPADHRRASRQGEGLRRRCTGRRCRPSSSTAARACPTDGFFLNPTLLDHVTTDMACYRDEIFGPVLSVVRVSGYQDGIDTINANPYANGTAIFTRDGGAARQFQFDVQVGMVGVNVPVPVPGQLLQLRRLEGEPVRRHPHVRARGHQLLHPRQGRHQPLARPRHQHHRPRLPGNPMRREGLAPGHPVARRQVARHEPHVSVSEPCK